VGQGKILRLEVVDVSEHLSLGMVGVENGVCHVGRGTLKVGRNGSDTEVAINLNGRN
jgi:hypothetical protein